MPGTKHHTDELGKLSIPRLLLKLTVPATIGMFVMVLYNVVDTIFVARYVGSMAIGGLAVVMPITMLISAVGMALGVGGASIISVYLGANERQKANTVFGNLLILTLTITLVFTILGYIFPDEVLKIFGAEGQIFPYAKEYYMITLFGSPFLALSMAGNNIIRSEGNARMSMIVMLISSILNLALDYLFIITFEWGIKGAAWATVISQILTFIFIAYYFIITSKSTVELKLHNLFLDSTIVKEVIAIGSSSFARQSATSIIAIFINHSLMQYGNEIDVSIYGILNRVMFFAFFPLIGLSQGFMPILSYNYGAKMENRVKETINLSFSSAFLIGIFAFVIMFFIPEIVFKVFTDDVELINQGVGYLKIVSITIPLVGIQFLGSSFFQAIGKAKPALYLTLSRQFLFIIPLILILPEYFGINGIWYAFPVSDVVSFALTIGYLFPFYKEFSSNKADTAKNFDQFHSESS